MTLRLMAIAALLTAATACEAADYRGGGGTGGYRNAGLEQGVGTIRRLPRKPYHMGVGGLIVVREPYGAWLHRRAIESRPRYWWGR